MNNKMIELRIPAVTMKQVVQQIRQTCPGEDIAKSSNEFIDLMSKVMPHCKTKEHKEEIVVKVQLASLFTGDFVKNRRN
ncbi:MAG: hypothetical protein AB1394_07480 [Bacteroidota bacterium]